MHTQILRRIAKLPVIREVLGAGAGCAVALAAYGAFEFLRGALGVGSFDVLGPVHAAAGAVIAQGTVMLGLTATLALAAGCAFVHRKAFRPATMSEID
jgi:hypothetical protein